MISDVDVLHDLEAEIEKAREAAGAAVGRAEALVELRSLALEVQGGHERPIHPGDLFDSGPELRRARARALARRITQTEEGA